MVITHLWLKIVTLKYWNIFGFFKEPLTSYTRNSHTVWVVHVIRKPIISSSKGVDQILWTFKLPLFRFAADVLSAHLIDDDCNFLLHFMIILMFMNQNWIGDHKIHQTGWIRHKIYQVETQNPWNSNTRIYTIEIF